MGWRLLVCTSAAAAALGLSGEAAAEGPGAPVAARLWQQVDIVASVDANQGMATRLDIVLVHDVALMPRLPVNAAQWFMQKDALQAGAGRGLRVVSLQVPPGSRLKGVKLPGGAGRAAGAFVYADLQPGSGLMAAPLAPHTCVQLALDSTALTQSACTGRR